MPTWLLREGNSAYYYDSQVTYKLAAWLTPTYALSIAQSFTDTEETVMSYFVRGLHMYEAGYDLRYIQTFMGHKSINSTTIYVTLTGKRGYKNLMDSMDGEIEV